MDASSRDTSRRRDLSVRESQLWWLALLVILLLTVTLLIVDSTQVAGKMRISQGLEFVLSTQVMRVFLALAILLICSYFRDTTRRLRVKNDRLIHSLSEYSAMLEKKNCDTTRLMHLSDALISVTDLQASLDLVICTAVEMTKADTASVMLRDETDDCLRVAASYGLSREIIESTRVKAGESIAGLVAIDGRGILLNSDELTGELSRLALRTKEITSSVIVPIHVGDEIRGVLSVARRRTAERLTDADLGVISTLANQASLVIQKIDLLTSLRRQVGKLESALQELSQAQASLMQSEKMASIGQLAGGVAHEINNPLQVILGRTELLLAEESRKSNISDLETVLTHTIRIADIVSNLLSFSRQSRDMEMRDLDVNDLIEKTLGLLEAQAVADNVLIERDVSPCLGGIHGASGQLQQVFTNIGINAFQAMRKQGGGIFTVRSQREGDTVIVEFSDTGPGIPADCLEKVFDPFFTTKPEGEGTGLGLSIAYGIIESHGGSISVRNLDGKGACFTVSLPVGCESRLLLGWTSSDCKDQVNGMERGN